MAAPDPRRGRSRGSQVLLGLAAAGFLLGGATVYRAVADAPAPPPQPSAFQSWADRLRTPTAPTAPTATPTPGQSDGSGGGTGRTPRPLGRSLPVRITVPRVGIDAPVSPTGTDAHGGVVVPDEDHAREAVWFDGSATPGQIGPSVILAHVDSWKLPLGEAAFYALGATRPGDVVRVTRADGTVADFSVDTVTVVSRNDFPTGAVYGPTTTPQLRLITCGGGFSKQGGYDGNVVVYAHFTGVAGKPGRG
ncbi:class F sortase [Streptacidiphilus jiangxiensis]|uniref:Sortase family protein n=1 Tax=Streptacidiphilus jiangxiensis TaxID=235985 RepID=A0A1H7JNQ7_STRJI|nr:class F sortase [Streptacidiphilus jiangxiensis]SEK76231.1 Sortase family protein [Streptacidiphilus jiangxiensis]